MGDRIAVTVTGTPQLALTIGNATGQAGYAADLSAGAKVVFTYTVATGDSDDDGVAIAADALALGDGTIRSGTADADLSYTAVAADASHKVDGVRATITAGPSVSSTPTNGDDFPCADGDRHGPGRTQRGPRRHRQGDRRGGVAAMDGCADEMADRSYPVGEQITPLVLPAATGGDLGHSTSGDVFDHAYARQRSGGDRHGAHDVRDYDRATGEGTEVRKRPGGRHLRESAT